MRSWCRTARKQPVSSRQLEMNTPRVQALGGVARRILLARTAKIIVVIRHLGHQVWVPFPGSGRFDSGIDDAGP